MYRPGRLFRGGIAQVHVHSIKSCYISSHFINNMGLISQSTLEYEYITEKHVLHSITITYWENLKCHFYVIFEIAMETSLIDCLLSPLHAYDGTVLYKNYALICVYLLYFKIVSTRLYLFHFLYSNFQKLLGSFWSTLMRNACLYIHSIVDIMTRSTNLEHV